MWFLCPVCLAVLPGGLAFQVAEHPAEVAYISKPTLQRNVGDIVRGGAQQFGGTFDTVIVQVIDGGSPGDLAEQPAQIPGRQTSLPGQIVQGQRFRIVGSDALQHLFYGQGTPFLPRGIGSVRMVQAVDHDLPQKLPKQAGGGELIPGSLGFHGLKQTAGQCGGPGPSGKPAFQPGTVRPDLGQALTAFAGHGQKAFQVQHHTFVNAVPGSAAVYGAVGNQ